MAKGDPAAPNSGGKFSGMMRALWNPKRREFLGRDGGGWGKLGIFYFFFYIGLAGFFCAMLAVFMAVSPRDRPRYFERSSRMRTRSTELSPGLGFRPQPDVDNNLIALDKRGDPEQNEVYIKSLNHYLDVFYWKKDPEIENEKDADYEPPKKFTIPDPGDCTSEKGYGYRNGKPCVLVKMNKIVGFTPQPGNHRHDQNTSINAGCRDRPDAISLHCYGEYTADNDNLGELLYLSEYGRDKKCGSLEKSWFPYHGKKNRRDVYQAPYVWVQLLNPKPNVLINVLCRVYGQNIEFEKKTARALTRFQVYVEDLLPARGASSPSKN